MTENETSYWTFRSRLGLLTLAIFYLIIPSFVQAAPPIEEILEPFLDDTFQVTLSPVKARSANDEAFRLIVGWANNPAKKTPQSEAEVRALFLKAFQAGHPRAAQNFLYYSQGIVGAETIRKKVVAWDIYYKYQTGHPEDAAKMIPSFGGLNFESGDDLYRTGALRMILAKLDSDFESDKSGAFLTLAAKKGHKGAFELLKEASEKGSLHASKALAKFYQDGITPENPQEGFYLEKNEALARQYDLKYTNAVLLNDARIKGDIATLSNILKKDFTREVRLDLIDSLYNNLKHGLLDRNNPMAKMKPLFDLVNDAKMRNEKDTAEYALARIASLANDYNSAVLYEEYFKALYGLSPASAISSIREFIKHSLEQRAVIGTTYFEGSEKFLAGNSNPEAMRARIELHMANQHLSVANQNPYDREKSLNTASDVFFSIAQKALDINDENIFQFALSQLDLLARLKSHGASYGRYAHLHHRYSAHKKGLPVESVAGTTTSFSQLDEDDQQKIRMSHLKAAARGYTPSQDFVRSHLRQIFKTPTQALQTGYSYLGSDTLARISERGKVIAALPAFRNYDLHTLFSKVGDLEAKLIPPFNHGSLIAGLLLKHYYTICANELRFEDSNRWKNRQLELSEKLSNFEPQLQQLENSLSHQQLFQFSRDAAFYSEFSHGGVLERALLKMEENLLQKAAQLGNPAAQLKLQNHQVAQTAYAHLTSIETDPKKLASLVTFLQRNQSSLRSTDHFILKYAQAYHRAMQSGNFEKNFHGGFLPLVDADPTPHMDQSSLSAPVNSSSASAIPSTGHSDTIHPNSEASE